MFTDLQFCQPPIQKMNERMNENVVALEMFEQFDKRTIGLSFLLSALSPSFNIGQILSFFQIDEKLLFFNDRLKMISTSFANNGQKSLIKNDTMISSPVLICF